MARSTDNVSFIGRIDHAPYDWVQARGLTPLPTDSKRTRKWSRTQRVGIQSRSARRRHSGTIISIARRRSPRLSRHSYRRQLSRRLQERRSRRPHNTSAPYLALPDGRVVRRVSDCPLPRSDGHGVDVVDAAVRRQQRHANLTRSRLFRWETIASSAVLSAGAPEASVKLAADARFDASQDSARQSVRTFRTTRSPTSPRIARRRSRELSSRRLAVGRRMECVSLALGDLWRANVARCS